MNGRSQASATVSKQLHRNIAYYSLNWSALYPCIKEKINSSVPSLSGIWEIYWLEKSFTPRILKMGRAWYGGLRNELRVEADETELRNRPIREYLASGDCYYRYLVCEVATDLAEIYDVVTSIRKLPGPAAPPEKRYADVRISEADEMHIHRIRRSHEKAPSREPFGKHVPNMFDVLEVMKQMNHDVDK